MCDPRFDIPVDSIWGQRAPARNSKMVSRLFFPHRSSLHRSRSLHYTYFCMEIPTIATKTVTAIGWPFGSFSLLILNFNIWRRQKIWNWAYRPAMWTCHSLQRDSAIYVWYCVIFTLTQNHKICSTPLAGVLTLHQCTIAQMINRSSCEGRIPSQPCCDFWRPWQHSNYSIKCIKKALPYESLCSPNGLFKVMDCEFCVSSFV